MPIPAQDLSPESGIRNRSEAMAALLRQGVFKYGFKAVAMFSPYRSISPIFAFPTKLMSDYKAYTDEALLGLLNAGERASFDEIYRRYWPLLFQKAYVMLKDRDAALDILQDLFFWVWKHRENLRVTTSLKAYLSVSVYYKTANYIRQGKMRATFFEELKMAETTFTEEDQLELKELKALIQKYTDLLPEKCRNIYLLSRNEQLSNKEIAERLGISVKTVEAQMTIALRRLRSSLEITVLWLVFFL